MYVMTVAVRNARASLDHAGDELVDLVLAVAPVTLSELSDAVTLADEALAGGLELEGPEEVDALLEVGASSVDLVDHVLNAVDAVLAEVLRDELVVLDTDTLAGTGVTNTDVAALVQELADHRKGRIAVGDEGLDVLEHLLSGLVHLDELTVVDLKESHELEHLAGLRSHLVDTALITEFEKRKPRRAQEMRADSNAHTDTV